MTDETVAPDLWGKRVLEELLFRAAERVGEHRVAGESARVTLTFELRANREEQCLEIRLPDGVEAPLVTRLHKPF